MHDGGGSAGPPQARAAPIKAATMLNDWNSSQDQTAEDIPQRFRQAIRAGGQGSKRWLPLRGTTRLRGNRTESTQPEPHARRRHRITEWLILLLPDLSFGRPSANGLVVRSPPLASNLAGTAF